MAVNLKEGQGWRLGWSPDATVFKGLIGGEDWALELTEAEFEDFCRLSLQLADALGAIATELMDEERVSCEQETERIWLEAEGFPHSYTLRFILLTGRKAEGGWPEAATAAIVRAIPAVKLF